MIMESLIVKKFKIIRDIKRLDKEYNNDRKITNIFITWDIIDSN